MASDTAPRDGNRVTTLLGVSSLDFAGTVTAAVNPSTHALLVEASFTPSGTQDVNLTEVGGTAVALGQTTMSASIPVAIASNQSALPVSQSGTWNINNVSGTVSLPTGASTLAEQQTQTTALGTLLTTTAFQARINTLGQKTMVNSTPVVLSSDQSSIPVTLTSTTITGTVAVTQSTSPWIVAGGGTAGSAATGVLTVQGIASMTPVQVSQATAANLNATVVSGNSVASAVPSTAFYQGLNDSAGNLVGHRAATSTLNTTTGIGANGMVAVFDDTTPTSITENQFGAVRMSANRNVYQTIRDAAGNERGVNVTAANALNSDLSSIAGTTAAVNNGGVSNGTLRVTMANDSTGVLASITTSVTPGTAAGNLGKAEDAGHSSGDTGVFVLGVRNDTLADVTTTSADYSQVSTDLKGRVMVGNSPRGLKANQVTTITTSTAETTIVTAVASTFLDLYGLIVTNTSATAVTVAIKDATAGTTRLNIAVPAGDTRGFMLTPDAAIKQSAVNNNWTATTQSVTSVIITALTVANV